MGINYYIFVSAILFGLGLLTVISAKDAVKSIAGIIMLFTASIINIAAFSGFWGMNKEGKLLIAIITITCAVQIGYGILLAVKEHRASGSISLSEEKQ